ncbi:hypothetical protein DFH08DRAFT_1052044 [Mycena albidolilacea]|uniref:Uncharacterized protein n=1 Tax=Mycena albidolilacea TaxID=1033008 RepID=A0AAD7ACJ4_9AGAR|nr:hypothetical protein DFH08DRAFT_1052044 [Mycena albidolilacea]
MWGLLRHPPPLPMPIRPRTAPQYSTCLPPLPACLQRSIPVPGHPYTTPPTLAPAAARAPRRTSRRGRSHTAAAPAPCQFIRIPPLLMRPAPRCLRTSLFSLPLNVSLAAVRSRTAVTCVARCSLPPVSPLLAHHTSLLLSAACVPRRLVAHHISLLLSAACVPRRLVAPHCACLPCRSLRTPPQLAHALPAYLAAAPRAPRRCLRALTTYRATTRIQSTPLRPAPTLSWLPPPVGPLTSSDAGDPVGIREGSNESHLN